MPKPEAESQAVVVASVLWTDKAGAYFLLWDEGGPLQTGCPAASGGPLVINLPSLLMGGGALRGAGTCWDPRGCCPTQALGSC